jgi:hypothetical protein
MIACVVIFSGYFFLANQKQKKGKKVIENTVSIDSVWLELRNG